MASIWHNNSSVLDTYILLMCDGVFIFVNNVVHIVCICTRNALMISLNRKGYLWTVTAKQLGTTCENTRAISVCNKSLEEIPVHYEVWALTLRCIVGIGSPNDVENNQILISRLMADFAPLSVDFWWQMDFIFCEKATNLSIHTGN